jgi:hypothetical protein
MLGRKSESITPSKRGQHREFTFPGLSRFNLETQAASCAQAGVCQVAIFTGFFADWRIGWPNNQKSTSEESTVLRNPAKPPLRANLFDVGISPMHACIVQPLTSVSIWIQKQAATDQLLLGLWPPTAKAISKRSRNYSAESRSPALPSMSSLQIWEDSEPIITAAEEPISTSMLRPREK